MDNLILKTVACKYKNEILPPFDNIINMLGFNSLCALSENFGGTSIYIPTKKRLFGNCIAKQIRSEFNGGNYRELAKKYEMCERSVRNITSAR